MDIGGHRFFSKDERILEYWKEIMPIQGKEAYDDKKLDAILSAGINYQKYNAEGNDVKIHMSREGQEIIL